MPTKHVGGRPLIGKKVVQPKECFSTLLRTLMMFLPIPMQGKYSSKDIHSLSIGMSSQKQTIHSLQPYLSGKMSETNFWYHISKFQIQDLITINHALLTNPILDFIRENIPYRLAIDGTDDPYYGSEIDENEGFIIGGKVKKSTNSFYKYMTLELLLPQFKVTISVLPMEKGVKNEEYIKKMLEVIDNLGLSIEVLLLDRGFYSSEVFKLLRKNKVPFIMPVKKHSYDMIQLLTGRRSRFGKYILNKSTDPLELDIAIRVCYLKGKYNKHELVNYGYVFSGLKWSILKISHIYEKRFGIESSYSIRNKVKSRTTTRKPTVRYYLFLVSMLFQNVWMMLRWKYFRKTQRGPSKVDEDPFRFDNFRLKVWERVIKVLNLVFETITLRPG
jgi:putative transposase